jgi:hypothetical protein
MTLREVLKARKQGRSGLIARLRDRTKAVEQLLDFKRQDSAQSAERPPAEQTEPRSTGLRLKRYRNE